MSFPVARAMAGASLAPLSKEQKKRLCILARRAYAVEQALGRTGTLDAEAWRRWMSERAVGIASLRACHQSDYLPLKAHFLDLIGETGEAMNAHLAAQADPRRQALYVLRQECQKATDVLDNPEQYIRGFVRHRRHVALEDAEPRVIWHAIFTLRRKVQTERAKRK
jgi:hypothetical protein